MTKKPTKKQLEMEMRRKQVAENILAGLNYREIAGAIKVSIGTVSSDFHRLIDNFHVEQITDTQEIIAVEVRRIDRALNAIWKKVTDGDLAAIGVMIKLQEQRAKYLGLYSDKDTPINLQQNVNVDVGKILDEILDKLPEEVVGWIANSDVDAVARTGKAETSEGASS